LFERDELRARVDLQAMEIDRLTVAIGANAGAADRAEQMASDIRTYAMRLAAAEAALEEARTKVAMLVRHIH
jgi:hypothetical protein